MLWSAAGLSRRSPARTAPFMTAETIETMSRTRFGLWPSASFSEMNRSTSAQSIEPCTRVPK